MSHVFWNTHGSSIWLMIVADSHLVRFATQSLTSVQQRTACVVAGDE
jgi:hypothetical protein